MTRRSRTRRTVVSISFFTCLAALSLGTTCPGGGTSPFDPPVPYGNRPPRVIITDVATPHEDNFFAEQGDVVTVAFTGEDGEDTAVVRVFASTVSNPTAADEVPISSGYPVGPGEGSGTAVWNTGDVVEGTYYIFAEIDDRTFDAATGLGNPAVRVTAAQPLLIAPIGTAPENGSPTVNIELPNTDAGVTNKDVVTLRFTIKDPNSDNDTINLTYYFDKDRNASNDASEPPIVVGTQVIVAGTIEPDVEDIITVEIEIDLNDVPRRLKTDAGGRPLPYYLRVHADDGAGGVVDAYAPGPIRVLAAASDVIDLLEVGSTTAGATWQGFNGFPTDASRGSRAGAAFTSLGDIDGDGLDDFAIAAQTASPYNRNGVGEVYTIYGRKRRLDPEQLTFGFAQGRYSGVIGLNSVSTFVPFPEEDPRYETIFNVRGNQVPGPWVYQPEAGGNGSIGITCLARMPDMTRFDDTSEERDTTPELIVGMPYADSVTDQEDLDPCDECVFDDDDVAPFVCFTNAEFNTGENALTATIEGISAVDAGAWAPFNPAEPIPFFPPPNVDLGLDDLRISTMLSFSILVSGAVPDGPGSGAPFNVTVKLEHADGPEVTQLIDPEDPTGDPGEETGGGEFEEVAISFTVPFPPDDFPIGEGEPIPPSTFDGLFSLFLRSAADVEFDSVEVSIECVTVEPEEHPIRFTYFDGLPASVSTTGGCPEEDPVPALPLLAVELDPVCPPMNRSQYPPADPGSLQPDGHMCGDVGDVLIPFNPDEDGNDDLTSLYQSGFVFICANDNMVMRVNEDTGLWLGESQGIADATRQVRRVARMGVFGQPFHLGEGGEGLTGARFRGAWYGDLPPWWVSEPIESDRRRLYDPTSLFGYTVDSMPDLNAFGQDAVGEMLVSAPGQGVVSYFEVDLSTELGGEYDAGVQTSLSGSFDFETTFSNVIEATLYISGEARNLARLRVSINDPETGDPISWTAREILLWSGASPPPEEDAAPLLDYDSFFPEDIVGFSEFFIELPMPRLALALLQAGQGSLTLEILEDCTIDGSAVRIDEAIFALTGTPRNVGTVFVMDGWDWTSDLRGPWGCLPGEDGDAESGLSQPMSWPSASCTDGGLARWYCYPDIANEIRGEQANGGFGWARYAGDVGGTATGVDGNPDIVCGEPLNDNNPFDPDYENCPPEEEDVLTDNGKLALIYGRLGTLGDGMPCELERFEIRGTHDDDQFGRVQGDAGDINGDGNDDMFFAAEGYDATDGLQGVPIKGADAGFVGVLFGGPTVTGEATITAEEVGTANYIGCKFVGGSAGARLGGGGPAHPLIPGPLESAEPIIQRGQHGVSSAGDFNLDGFDDLLITAPGQEWPGARIEFNGAIFDGSTVTINGTTFEFDTNGVTTPGRTPVSLSSASATAAQEGLLAAMTIMPKETLNVAAIRAQQDFPAPLPDIPTISFLGRRADSFSVSKVGTNITVTKFVRQGVAYLVYGSNSLLENKTFVLPKDLNRRVGGKRILKGAVFVSAYEKDTGLDDETPDEATVDVVARLGDIDGDGFTDIIFGAPEADFINILAPNQRRQASGDAYLIYGNEFGLNKSTAP
ncbi:MAG: integrin alpha [Planctomycetota bacterium]